MVWCDWEQEEFERDKFKTFGEGPLLEHLDVKPRHTNNGIEIGRPGPEPQADTQGADGNEQPARSTSVTYGYGPMAQPPDTD